MDEEIKIGEMFKKAGLFAMRHSPVLGIAGAWWAKVFQNPIVALGIGLCYELLLWFWKEIGKPVSEAVWEKDVKPKTIDALTEWSKSAAGNLFSGFRFDKQYLQQIIYDHRMFGVRGLRIQRESGPLWVEQVFVELQIAQSYASHVSNNPIEVKSLSGCQPIWSFLKKFKKQEAVALAILGPPGCGKTSLLKNVALVYAAKKHRTHRLSARIPILLILREHSKIIADSSPKLPDLAQQHYSDQNLYPELNPPPPYWFSRQLTNGKCLIMLDGFDEVDEAHRAAVSEWVDRQIRNYPKCRFILTSRQPGYLKAPLERAYIFEVLPFTTEQSQKFIRNWYMADKLCSREDDPGVRQEARREAEELIQRLEDEKYRQLKALTVNPLLLTMIVNVHKHKELPKRRVDLYSEICNVMLEQWLEGKGLKERLVAKQKRAVLEPLAEEMMNREIREIGTKDALAVMMPHLDMISVEQSDKEGFLHSVQSGSGLIVEHETGKWGFAHLTFQEYLCASRWCKPGKASAWDIQQWQPMIAQSWWHETMCLYAAQAEDADILINACLKLNTLPALQLSGNIIKEALKVDPPLRESVKLILAQMSVIHLRKEPITVSDEKAKSDFGLGENWRPLEYIQNDFKDNGDGTITDHATGLMWQKSGSDERLTYQDAKAYVDGLKSKKFAGHSDWRLPTVDELKSLLMPERQSNGLYINPIFDKTQRWCWTSDNCASGGAWYVNFDIGDVYWLDGSYIYARAVRSRQ